MTFQFLCPQGHLLQGEEWQAGHQSICPICQSVFLIPSPVSAGGGTAPGGEGVYIAGGISNASIGGLASPMTTSYGSVEGPPIGLVPTQQASPAFPAVPPSGGQWVSAEGIQPPPATIDWPSPSQQLAPDQMPGIAPEAPAGIGVEMPPVHIFCPSGHELETPREMLGQEAICPFCQVQFRLRWEDTLEYRREKQLEAERRLARQSRLWLQWSIAVAVAVVIGLIIMFAIAGSR